MYFHTQKAEFLNCPRCHLSTDICLKPCSSIETLQYNPVSLEIAIKMHCFKFVVSSAIESVGEGLLQARSVTLA